MLVVGLVTGSGMQLWNVEDDTLNLSTFAVDLDMDGKLELSTLSAPKTPR